MKYILLLLIVISQLLAIVVKSPIVSVNENEKTATIEIDKIDVGMSGFIVHKLDENHAAILKNIVVSSYDKESRVAILKMSEYNILQNSALPEGKWKVEKGDTAVLAFGYSRALLIAPSEDIYYKVTRNTTNLQWIYPDMFATMLSFSGHPTPLKSDFDKMSDATAVGILFIYLEQKIFTLDAKSFKILNISEAPLVQDKVNLPFYTRIEEIEANWWGEGSDKLKDYESYYYELLVKFNKSNKELYEIVKNSDKKLTDLLKDFKIEEKI